MKWRDYQYFERYCSSLTCSESAHMPESVSESPGGAEGSPANYYYYYYLNKLYKTAFHLLLSIGRFWQYASRKSIVYIVYCPWNMLPICDNSLHFSNPNKETQGRENSRTNSKRREWLNRLAKRGEGWGGKREDEKTRKCAESLEFAVPFRFLCPSYFTIWELLHRIGSFFYHFVVSPLFGRER